MRGRILGLTIAVIASSACGLPTEGEDDPLEKSRPAFDMAGEDEALDPPVAFGFEMTPLAASAGDTSGFPRWYCPSSVITRAHLASFIARAVVGPNAPMPVYDGRFSDVTDVNRHASAIAWVADQGISTGCAEGAFCPDDGVTRGQLALFTVRMMHGADYILPTPTKRYVDVPSDHMHAAAIEQLALDGIDVGCDASSFCPDAAVTRDDVAAFLVPAKYRTSSPGAVTNVFADIAATNPHRDAVNVLARDGVDVGCTAPNAGYRLNGEPLTDRQRDWLLYFAGHAMPRLTQTYGDAARAHTVGARVVWWGLKEGVFGTFDDPFRHAVCDGQDIGAFDNCAGDWEVGVTAAVVPSDAEVRAAAAAIYPARNPSDVAVQLVEFGASLSATFDAGEYPDYALDRVMEDPALQRSWLARDPMIGAYLMIDRIEQTCFAGTDACYGNETEALRDFARDETKANAVLTDIRRILVHLRPR